MMERNQASVTVRVSYTLSVMKPLQVTPQNEIQVKQTIHITNEFHVHRNDSLSRIEECISAILFVDVDHGEWSIISTIPDQFKTTSALSEDHNLVNPHDSKILINSKTSVKDLLFNDSGFTRLSFKLPRPIGHEITHVIVEIEI
ncbi:hypothetical protein C9374_000922 [Naegleria lovaniensis]|uniref:Uncharacterized protein n=1 Tax=Naegleria lovaniensis TaxID=51637 RepID=A0AA88GSH8_NAELO|nr:uncharacterized protein C9374_000922 [Naegleria lovaniensis]KAG2388072.1 hypothetical protein C9374_000922 [Naegleria lovaniensis]